MQVRCLDTILVQNTQELAWAVLWTLSPSWTFYVMTFHRMIQFLTNCGTKQLNTIGNVQNSTEAHFKVSLSKYLKVATYTVQKIVLWMALTFVFWVPCYQELLQSDPGWMHDSEDGYWLELEGQACYWHQSCLALQDHHHWNYIFIKVRTESGTYIVFVWVMAKQKSNVTYSMQIGMAHRDGTNTNGQLTAHLKYFSYQITPTNMH